jgi:hypothetical protein
MSAAVIITTAWTCEQFGGVPLGLPDPPILAVIGVIAFGVIANVCYTGGWIVELLVAKAWRVESTRFGPIAFTLGTAFSVLVAFAPAGLNLAVAALTRCHGLT